MRKGSIGTIAYSCNGIKACHYAALDGGDINSIVHSSMQKIQMGERHDIDSNRKGSWSFSVNRVTAMAVAAITTVSAAVCMQGRCNLRRNDGCIINNTISTTTATITCHRKMTHNTMMTMDGWQQEKKRDTIDV